MQLYFEKHDTDIARIATSDAMRTVLSLWETSRRQADIPDYATVNVSTMPQIGSRCLFAIPAGGDDYEFIYVGPEVADDVKIPVVGISILGMGDQFGKFFVDCFKQVTKCLKPLYTIHHSEIVHSIHTWENLMLPVRMLDERIGILVYNSPLLHHHSLLSTVLETVHEGIISLRAVRDGDNRIVDATVISSNPAAENMMGHPGSSMVGRRLKDVVPSLWEDYRWAKYVEVMETGNSFEYQSRREVDGEVSEVRISLNKMGDGLTITFTDITQFVLANEKLERQHQELIEANKNLKMQATELAALATNLERTHTELNREIRHRKALEIQLRRQAETDPLTGIANRRRLLERGASEIMRANRYDRQLSVIMIDIDHFKAVNDSHGHAAGDIAILSIAELCRATVRDGADQVGRLGGEEFAILLPETDIEQTEILAERLRQKCDELIITHNQHEFSVTISLGIAGFQKSDTDITHLLDRADGALYAAKHAGRNRVRTALENA